MLNFINQNSGLFLVIFSGVVALATVFYVLLTRGLVLETKKLRRAQTEPQVLINLQTSEAWISLLDLVIQNIGLGAAHNLTFEVNPDLQLRTGRKLSEVNFIKNGLKCLAPNQKITCFIGNLIEEAKKEKKTVLEISVSYENKKGDREKESFTLDFSEFFGLVHVGESPLKKIANNLEKIQRDIHSIMSSTYPKIKVLAYTKKDIEEEHLKILEEERRLEEEKRGEENKKS